jgi:hypothetical protein
LSGNNFLNNVRTCAVKGKKNINVPLHVPNSIHRKNGVTTDGNEED